MTEVIDRPGAGPLLREWRQRRGLSQMALALEADVSARHVSFVETGRSRPSAEMVMTLAEQLEVPLRDRNQLLLAAGYAPAYGQRDLEDPEMEPVRDAIARVLGGHEPSPAVVVDRHWGLVGGNSGVALLSEGVAGHLLESPANVLRISLHPDGMAPRILNLPEWREHVLGRLNRQAIGSGDPALAALHEELAAYPGAASGTESGLADTGIVTPLHLHHDGVELAFVSTYTTFETPTDVTVSELAIESFFPADDGTARYLRDRAG